MGDNAIRMHHLLPRYEYRVSESEGFCVLLEGVLGLRTPRFSASDGGISPWIRRYHRHYVRCVGESRYQEFVATLGSTVITIDFDVG